MLLTLNSVSVAVVVGCGGPEPRGCVSSGHRIILVTICGGQDEVHWFGRTFLVVGLVLIIRLFLHILIDIGFNGEFCFSIHCSWQCCPRSEQQSIGSVSGMEANQCRRRWARHHSKPNMHRGTGWGIRVNQYLQRDGEISGFAVYRRTSLFKLWPELRNMSFSVANLGRSGRRRIKIFWFFQRADSPYLNG